MQNIDILYVIQYIVVIGISVGLLIYWRVKHAFKGTLLGLSAIAYLVAIILKYAVQIPTIAAVSSVSLFGSNAVILGLYYGIQTAAFEVGFAYLVARLATRRGKFTLNDAGGYGLGLGFWENAIWLGALQLVNLITYFAILSTNRPIATTLYNQLRAGEPALFDPPSAIIGGGIVFVVERTSSILAHLAWGYLCFVAACTRKPRYFWIAFPMGFIDFLVPFALALTIIGFEALVFTISVACVFLAWFITKKEREMVINAAPIGP